MSNKATIGMIVVLLALISSIACAMLRGRQSPEMREVRQLQEKLLNEETRNSMTAEQQGAALKELREKTKVLSKEEQVQLGKEKYEHVMKRKLQYVDRFFALKTKEERDAYLDREIDRWESYGKKDEVKGKSKGKRNVKKERGKGGIRSAEEQRDRLRAHLDSTSADQRAQFSAYYEALMARSKQRGWK